MGAHDVVLMLESTAKKKKKDKKGNPDTVTAVDESISRQDDLETMLQVDADALDAEEVAAQREEKEAERAAAEAEAKAAAKEAARQAEAETKRKTELEAEEAARQAELEAIRKAEAAALEAKRQEEQRIAAEKERIYQTKRLNEVKQRALLCYRLEQQARAYKTQKEQEERLAAQEAEMQAMRQQPKLPDVEERLAAKYEGMSVGDRAFQILVDLGLVQETGNNQ